MKNFRKILFGFLAVMLIIPIGIWAVKSVNADSAGSVSVTSIDYDNMTLTIKGNGDKVFYLSDSKQKKWDKVIGEEKNGSVTMDISWISAYKNYVLSLKGDKSTEPVKVTVPQCNSKFKAKYDKATGTVTYTGISKDYAGKIQWRVKGSTEWNDTTVSDETLKDKLGYYINEMAATTVYFRTAPVNGTSIEDAGTRASKEVYCSMAKKTTAPNIVANGSTFMVTVPAGVQYRLVGNSDWSGAVNTSQEIDLREIAPGAFCSDSNSSPSNQAIEFRKTSTSSAQISASTIFYLNAQQSASDAGLDSDSVEKSYLSANALKVYFELSEENQNKAYEYTISSDGSQPASDTKWTALPTKSKTENTVKTYYVTKNFSSSELKTGDTLWIRKKTDGKAGNNDFTVASYAYSWQAGDYPAASEDITGEAKSIIGIKNTRYQTDISFSYAVDASLQEEITRISAINLYKDKEAKDATATLPNKKEYYTVPDSYTTSEDGKKRIYTFQINAAGITDLLANTKLSADTAYYFGIVLESGEKIVTDTTLTSLQATKISSSSEFVKIAGYDKEFTLTLDYGSKKAELCRAEIICAGSNKAEIVETKNGNQNTQTITFKLKDDYFVEGKADIAINISYTNDAGTFSETLTGIKATLEQPVVSSSDGSISFTEGACSKDIEFDLMLNSSKQVTSDFGVTDILWGTTSIKENMMVVQKGTSLAVTLSAERLNALGAGANYVEVEVNGKVLCKTTFRITILESSGSMAFAAVYASLRSYSDEPDSINIQDIDYAKNQILINLNGNRAGLFSVDKKKWYVLGDRKDASGHAVFNISWVPDSKAYTIYFKGIDATSEEEYAQVVLPKKNSALKATFDKRSDAEEPVITVTKADEGVQLQWRKSTSYVWHTASVLEDEKYVIPELEYLRVEGGKIVVRTIAVNGTDDSDTGIRYSKEITVRIAKRLNAPSVEINPAKMNVNTSAALEYYDAGSKKWVSCTKNMSVWDFPVVASEVKAGKSSAGSDVTISFRKAAVKRSGYSKTIDVVFAGQEKAPVVTDTERDEVVYSEKEKTVRNKTVTECKLTFNKAEKTKKYQYVVVPEGETFVEGTAKWSTVAKATTVTLNKKQAVPGSTVYVRILGTAANASKNTDAVLSSAVGSYKITGK